MDQDCFTLKYSEPELSDEEENRRQDMELDAKKAPHQIWKPIIATREDQENNNPDA